MLGEGNHIDADAVEPSFVDIDVSPLLPFNTTNLTPVDLTLVAVDVFGANSSVTVSVMYVACVTRHSCLHTSV